MQLQAVFPAPILNMQTFFYVFLCQLGKKYLSWYIGANFMLPLSSLPPPALRKNVHISPLCFTVKFHRQQGEGKDKAVSKDE